ncbi:type I phosphomannose isomerase catalytic subunit [Isosphaeraceae bacterium EP7]
MDPINWSPLRFEPILKRLIWGGRRLGTVLRKPIGDAADYAESWELSDHREDVSVVADGPLKGTSLRTLVREHADALFGSGKAHPRQFPLLVKFLDANQVLSVQVHPDDALGRRLVDDNGKTEAWVILHAEPGSLIYAGLNEGVTRDQFARAFETGEFEPLLHAFEAKVGQCILIPAGTVHAIGAGVLLAEIQQMSDATFRVHDWHRVGPDGKPRTLHPAQALEATDFQAGPVRPLESAAQPIAGGTRETLASSDYFRMERLTLGAPTQIGSHDRFTIVLGMEGDSVVRKGPDGRPETLKAGETLLLPAALGVCDVEPRGTATILTCVVP